MMDNKKKIEELLKTAYSQEKKLDIPRRKIKESKDGRLIINRDNEFEREWYDNDDKYDLL